MIDFRKFTVDDYHLMAETGLFCRGDRTVRRTIYAVTPIGRRHAAASLSSPPFFLLYGARCAVGAEPASVPTYGEPEPDVAVLRLYEYEVPKPHNVLVVIEVADSTPGSNHTQCFDRRVKLLIYAGRASQSWIINLVHDQTEVYLEPEAQTTGSRTCL